MKTTALKMLTASAVTGLAALSMNAPAAHHSAAASDTTAPVIVAGVIVRFDAVNPHSYLYIERKTADGRSERWAVEGPAGAQLDRRGIQPARLVAGATFVACGYVLKEPSRGSQPTEGTVLLAELVTMPDGETRLWSPYGNTHCQERYAAKGRLTP